MESSEVIKFVGKLKIAIVKLEVTVKSEYIDCQWRSEYLDKINAISKAIAELEG